MKKKLETGRRRRRRRRNGGRGDETEDEIREKLYGKTIQTDEEKDEYSYF